MYKRDDDCLKERDLILSFMIVSGGGVGGVNRSKTLDLLPLFSRFTTEVSFERFLNISPVPYTHPTLPTNRAVEITVFA